MKTYVFFTAGIFTIGGMQTYVSNKAEYLEKHGWNVKVLFSTYAYGESITPYLSKYKEGLIQGLNIPPFMWPRRIYNEILGKAVALVDNNIGDEIIIESHNDTLALWGELVACKIGAKHIYILLNEFYRGANKYFEEKMDFFLFKQRRREIGGLESSFKKLFDGYLNIQKSDVNEFWIDENPIKDVINKDVVAIVKKDWNICYIGRPVKGYVPSIIKGVFSFAKSHADKTIQFIMLGDKNIFEKLLVLEGNIPQNLILTKLGVVVPIPKSLLQKVDVFIAGAGSARAIAYEKGLVIIPDVVNYMSNGLLGYDVQDAVYNEAGNRQRSIKDELERVLIEKVHEKMHFHFPQTNIETWVKQNFEFIQSSEQKQEYYNEQDILKSNKKISMLRLCMYYSSLFFPGSVQKCYDFFIKFCKF